MKIVFSRKGFDSASGGAPSPIIDGRPVSIPIPVRNPRSETTYGDVGLGKMVQRVTRGRLTASDLCHDDPVFESGRCAFGQTGAAQSHLANQGVGIGDVFLFFGLFSQPDGGDPHHRIYGYVEVAEVTKPGTTPTLSDQPPGFRRRHPHTIGQWNANNTIYTGSGDTAATDDPGLRLSLPNGPVSHWGVPSWLSDTGLSYHRNPTRWESSGVLRTAARGQEFVADATGFPQAEQWLRSVLALISREPPETDTLTDPRVVVVMLRQPRRHNDPRTDPLWEFGSFGCTGCHRRNLMNTHKMEELNGCRLAFAQGGDSEIRLVHVTPPVRMIHHGSFAEATWQPRDMPLAYDSAPLLVDNLGGSDFPVLMEMIDGVRRHTPVPRFASKFRSRRQPLPADIGRQLAEGYHGFRRRGARVARHYVDSLPYPPSRIDQDRKKTYHSLLALADQ
ncbi:MAG: hypothetical protein OXK76_09290 [Gammaproteobacteria bacterium]|nr:hypothetical protein [Gammaproteobacteria bacterium]